jgi:protein TonB
MRLEREADDDSDPWIGHRNFIVPPDIIPTRRVSPIPQKKRTLCRPRAEGEAVLRAGGRDWFSDRLFVDREPRDVRALYGGSVTVHASCLIGLLALVAGSSNSPTVVRAKQAMQMPVFVALMADGGGGSTTSRFTAAEPERRDAPPAKGGELKAKPAKAPPVAPSTAPVAPETVAERDRPEPSEPARTESEETRAENVEDTRIGTPEGLPGREGSGATTAGAGNGTGAGSGGTGAGVGGGSSAVEMSLAPYRLGNGIEPPRKIKDVRPAYPSEALASRALGTVVIEAVVGADGKVHNAKVLHSIPALDQAALDAVRQWEFEPSRLNGIAVAVIVTILVQFSFH